MPLGLDTQLKACSVLVKSYAKINLFLKIIGKTQINNISYHLLQSRFMRVSSLFDTLGFNFNAKEFTLIGDFDCSLEKNTIYKAFIALLPYVSKTQAKVLNRTQIVVQKKIPSGGGLGGGSSNAARFLQVVNRELNLGLNQKMLAEIGAKVGSDVPFFMSDLELADVEGRGEIVTPSVESKFNVEIINPKVHSSTAEVFKMYAREFYRADAIPQIKAESWLQKSNAEILSNDAFRNNDLLKPLLSLHPELESYCQKGVFLSGSGSCFWRKCEQTESGIAQENTKDASDSLRQKNENCCNK
ncbi:4-(cytidine 5'-diphospho)-2-C-methyl-D-erythritol kinase [Helicobacter sp.]|uniref:4-(cytidine 5'-diphospho)-2-C-methyl-D-erythritol kinase n=1 Tax=Helicobacter sp. TaxID=218 RepID=UPI0025BFEBCC|nr:4-(cytidine 5'-diphospho)-2-C-methyl-D-erythritol kinase [Helicobacter sp.]MCI5968737.1 4-(cytidine 5'-diphospho)-2-C-methyl-D-erythritol kinase [Helicobacter sp.]MDY2584560.1 4-(cytidine 5'-diphospho)-2-C-methyl-D-erythritol kinase [Helicobacter sp.]